MKRVAEEKIVDLILKVRNGCITIKPGYDGVYGKIEPEKEKGPQRRLSDFSTSPQQQQMLLHR